MTSIIFEVLLRGTRGHAGESLDDKADHNKQNVLKASAFLIQLVFI